MTAPGTHKCPAPACTIRVPRSQLACRVHWFAIPKWIRDWVWSAHRRGTSDHLEAVRAAVESLRGNTPRQS